MLICIEMVFNALPLLNADGSPDVTSSIYRIRGVESNPARLVSGPMSSRVPTNSISSRFLTAYNGIVVDSLS